VPLLLATFSQVREKVINTKDPASKLSSSSLPGLTPQSIVLKILGFFKMDARVKPAHDESIIARMSIKRIFRLTIDRPVTLLATILATNCNFR
jgi:hypothetical protein